jgi:hypothetical protein
MSVESLLPASLLTKIGEALAGAETYIRGRQSAEGGFCFYRSTFVDEPFLGDTYYAISALRLLGVEVPRAADAAEFVSRASLFGLNYLYFYAFSLDLLGYASLIRPEPLASIRELGVAAPDAQAGVPTGEWLENTRKTVQLQKRFAGSLDHSNVVRYLRNMKRNGGFGNAPNLVDTHRALEILMMIDPDGGFDDTASFINELQKPPAGFTATRESSAANLEVLEAGVKCCSLLHVPVRHRVAVLEFALACQCNNGGFSRVPVALPDLEQTHRALQTIVLLAPDCRAAAAVNVLTE